MVAVGKAETKQNAPRRFESKRIDELLPHEAHGGRAEDDHALLVQTDDPLVGTKVQELGEMQRLRARSVRLCRSFHRESIL